MEASWRNILEMKKELFLFPPLTLKQILSYIDKNHELFYLDFSAVYEIEDYSIKNLFDIVVEPDESLIQFLLMILSPIVFFKNFTKYFRETFYFDYEKNFNYKYIIDWRILATEKQTLQEIGESLNITRERVRQIEASLIERLKCWISQEDIAMFLAYLKATDCSYIENDYLANTLISIDHTLFYFDKDLGRVMFKEYQELVEEAKSDINKAIQQNKVLDMDHVKEFAYDVSQQWAFSFTETFEILNHYVNKQCLIVNNMAYLQKIKKREALEYIFKTHYSDQTLDLSDKESFDQFKDYFKKLFPHLDIFSGSEDRVLARLAGLFSRIDQIVKINANRYRLLNHDKLPYHLLDQVYQFINNELDRNGFVSNKKVFREFEDQILSFNYDEKSFYYIYKYAFEEDFYFAGRTSLRIFRDESEVLLTEEIVKNAIVSNNGEITLGALCSEIGVEEYSIWQLAGLGKIRIRSNHVALPMKVADLSLELKESIIETVNDSLRNRKFVSIKDVYDKYRFSPTYSTELINNDIKEASDFRILLLELNPKLVGHSRVLFLKGEEVDYFGLFISIIGKKTNYQKSDFLEAGEKIGLAVVTSSAYFFKFVQNKSIIPLNEDYYILKEQFEIDKKTLEFVAEILEETDDNEDYISLSKIKKEFYVLPKNELISWTTEVINYVATEYLGYYSIDFEVGDFNENPYIITKNESLTYRDLIEQKMMSFNGIRTESRILTYLQEKGLLQDSAKRLFTKFYSKGILTKNEFGRVNLMKVVDEV